MNRLAICGILLGFGTAALAQDLSQKVTIDIPAARASVALKALSKATGVNFEPAANLKDEVFVIHAVDATVQEIMDRIAQAESGRWSLQSGTYLLVRESSTSVAQERAELRARAKAITDAIVKLGQSAKSHPAFDEAAAQKLTDEQKRFSEQLQSGNLTKGARLNIDPSETPTGRAIARILAAMDADKLAQIGMNQRVVFSTHPTNMQLGLGAPAARAFETFVQEQALYSRVYNQGENQDGNKRVMMFNGVGTPNMGSGDPSRGLGLGLVVVQRRFGQGLSIEILAADPSYETISSGSYMLQLPELQPSETKPAAAEKPLEISPESKELAKALGGGAAGVTGGQAFVAVKSTGGPGGEFVAQAVPGGDRNPVKLSPELREKVLNPETYEPLAFAPGEAMLSLAKNRNKNLVALLPDYCFSSLTREMATEMTASQLVASLETSHGLRLEEKDGWLVVSPTSPYSARAGKVDRSAIGKLIRQMDHDKALPLDTVAAFAVSQTKTPGFNDIDMIYPRLIDSALTNEALAPLASGSFSLYKFYGSLSPMDRRAVAEGKQFSFATLSPGLKNLVADMLYNSPQGPTVTMPQQQRGREERSITVTAVQGSGGVGVPMFFGGSLSAKNERTIILPNGVPANGFMVGSLREEQVAQGLNSQTQSRSFLDPGSIALSRSTEAQGAMNGFTPQQFDQYRMGRRVTFSINFNFRPDVSMARSLSDTSADPNSSFGPYDSLPGDFRARVAAMEQNLKNVFDKIPGGTQGTPPP